MIRMRKVGFLKAEAEDSATDWGWKFDKELLMKCLF